ncbi:glycosyltransferase [Sinomonas atrocyanea]
MLPLAERLVRVVSTSCSRSSCWEFCVPLVSVVIPTILRKSLLNAVRSARGQETVSVQLVVVVDRYSGDPDWDNLKRDLGLGDNDLLILRAPEDDRSARQLGVDSSTAPYIAFLDDDDEWDSKNSNNNCGTRKSLRLTASPDS